MATVIDTLVTVFTMDKRKFDAGAKDMKNTLQGLKSIAQTVGGIALFGYASGLVKDFVTANAELARFSDTIHDNIEDVQAWGKVLEKEGGSLQSLQGTLTRLSMMGRGLREPTKILRQMADRMKGMSYWQAKMYGSRFGIDDATIRVLQKGGREVDRLLKRAKQLGVYNKTQLEQARKLKNSWQEMGQAVSYFGGQIALALLPAIQWLTDAFVTFGVFINEHSDAIKDFLTFITSATLIKGLHALGLAGLKATGWIALWVAGFALLFLAFNDFMSYLRGGDSLIGRVIKSFSDFSNAIKNQGGVWIWFCNIMKKAFASVYDWIVSKWDALLDKFSIIKNFIHDFIKFLPFDMGSGNIPAMVGAGIGKDEQASMNNSRTTTINVDRMEFNSNGQTPLQFTQNSANQFMSVVNQADMGGL